MYSNRPNEIVNVCGTIQPVGGSANTYLSDAIPLDSAIGRRFMATILTGAIGSSGTVNGGFQWSATSGGSYANITGAQLTADTTGGNVHRIVLGADWVKYLYPTATYIKLSLVTAVAATPIAAVVEGYDCVQNPSVNNAAAAFPTSTNAQLVTTDA